MTARPHRLDIHTHTLLFSGRSHDRRAAYLCNCTLGSSRCWIASFSLSSADWGALDAAQQLAHRTTDCALSQITQE